MSRIERLKEIAAMKGPAGASTEKNIGYWSGRASAHSQKAPRAKGGEMKLPSTGEMATHDTSRGAAAIRARRPRAISITQAIAPICGMSGAAKADL